MDLDKLKKSWTESSVNTSTPIINNDNLFVLIHSKGKTALEKLMILEVVCAVLAVLCVGFPHLHGLLFPRIPMPILLKYSYIVLCVVWFLWQLYKIRLLKKIDVRKESLLSCSKYILRYRMNIRWELIFSLILIFIFVFSFTFSYSDKLLSDRLQLFFYLFNILNFGVVGYITYLFYGRFYLKRIKELMSALDEVKELDNGNEESIHQ